MKSSRIFSPHRALGFVSNHVPLSLRYIQRRKENLVVTCVGKCFHTYGCDKLTLLSVSEPHSDEIECLTSDSFLVFTSVKNVIYAWRRGTELKHVYKGHEKNIHIMLPFGQHLLSVDENNILIVWDVKSEEIVMELPFSSTSFYVTTLMHPSTYLNKILFGSKQGKLQLWNLRTCKLIFEFEGWNSPVTVLEKSPAVDVVAIGLLSGDIYIHNLRLNETIMKFFQDWGPITAISFRTDDHPIMVSASTVGHIAVWNLNKKKLHSEIRHAHNDAVTGMKFLPNEPLLITSSPDNTLKLWIFDMPDDGGRLLKLREGHNEPPIKIRFHGLNGKSILSSGLDSTLRSFSTAVDNLNKNLGQASYNRKRGKRNGIKNDSGKLPPIIDFTSEITREKEWDNIAACHRNLDIVTTWTYDNCRMGDHKLTYNFGAKDVSALCITLSACGNFVLIGYSNGYICKFNIQSGILRGTCIHSENAHKGSIRGLVCDGLNQIVASGGSDAKLKLWKFKDCSLMSTLTLKCSVAKMIMHRENSLIAIAMDNFIIEIISPETRKLVRKFTEHGGQITDMAFSVDSRWLIVACMDLTIKVWDLPTGNLLDSFLVSPVCVSLTMSPTSEYLATVHAGDLGIYLWRNKTLYQPVSLTALPHTHEPKLMDLPAVSLAEKSGKMNVEDDGEMEVEILNNSSDDSDFKSPDQITKDFATLSLLPSSHWKNLLNLDVIKMRNKPKEPVKTAKNAPFFLPVVSGLKPTFDIDKDDDNEAEKIKEDEKLSRLMQHGSAFTELLALCDKNDSFEPIITKLKNMMPSLIDVEIRCLDPENGGSIEAMLYFMKAMNYGLTTRKNFELIQTYLALFLKVHGKIISETDELSEYLNVLKVNQIQSWTSLQQKFHECLCLSNYLRSSLL